MVNLDDRTRVSPPREQCNTRAGAGCQKLIGASQDMVQHGRSASWTHIWMIAAVAKGIYVEKWMRRWV
eukprot:4867330-Pyramimonas_sp.AAC.1